MIDETVHFQNSPTENPAVAQDTFLEFFHKHLRDQTISVIVPPRPTQPPPNTKPEYRFAYKHFNPNLGEVPEGRRGQGVC